jgi:hypothetical protein
MKKMAGTIVLSIIFVGISIILLFAHPTNARANIVSDFTSGTDGWIARNLGAMGWSGSWFSPWWNATEQCLTLPDDVAHSNVAPGSAGPFTTVWISPAKFRGDMTAYYGGTLEFDLKDYEDSSTASSTHQNVPLVRLSTSDGSNRMGTPIPSSSEYPGNGWTHYSIPMVETSFNSSGNPVTREQFMTVLGNYWLGITAEFIPNNTNQEWMSLDNVMLTQSVPEPLSLSLLVFGFGGLMAGRKIFSK